MNPLDRGTPRVLLTVLALALVLLLASAGGAQAFTNQQLNEITEHLYRGGAGNEIPGVACGSRCSSLWTAEHGSMPTAAWSLELHRELFAIRQAVGLLPPRESLGYPPLGTTKPYISWRFGTSPRSKWIRVRAPKPTTGRAGTIARAYPVLPDEVLASSGGWEVLAPTLGFVGTDSSQSQLYDFVDDLNPGVQDPTDYPSKWCIETKDEPPLVYAGWQILRGPTYPTEVNCGTWLKHYEQPFTTFDTARADGSLPGAIEDYSAQAVTEPAITTWAPQPYSREGLRSAIVDLIVGPGGPYSTLRQWYAREFGGSEPISYVALGDSVAAGEGIGYGFVWGLEPQSGPSQLRWTGGSNRGSWNVRPETMDADWGKPDFCHQSPEAYPRLAAIRLRAETFMHLACTGSTAYNGVLGARIDDDGTREAERQLLNAPGTAYGDAAPDLVSLSLGANDVDFNDRVKDCYTHAACNSDENQQSLVTDLKDQRAGLEAVLRQIKSIGEVDGKKPVVALSLYYDPFPQGRDYDIHCVDISTPIGRSGDFGGVLSINEMGYLRDGLQRLNANINTVANLPEFRHMVMVVSAPSEFRQHSLCTQRAGDAGPWVFGPSIATQGAPWSLGIKAPFHPIAAGQEAIARDVVGKLGDSRKVASGRSVAVGFDSGALVSFDEVTTPGTAVMSGLDPVAAPPNTDFAVLDGFVEITASADYRGPITVSLPSTAPAKLYHYTNNAWEQVPSAFDDGFVTGTVSDLSPFALGTSAPTVNASFTDSGGGLAPAPVSFDASASSAQSGSIAGYQWDFGDGTTGSGRNPSHTYPVSGSYEVMLRVRSDRGAVAEARRTVTVTNAPPIARLDAPLSVPTRAVVSLNASRSSDPNGAVSRAVWDFGDGSEPTEGMDLTHRYATEGAYTIRVAVLDNEGEAAYASSRIQIQDPSSIPGVVAPTPLDTAPPDTTPPRISALSLTDRRFAVATTLRTRTTRRRLGTRFRYTLSELATMRIRFERALPGRRVGTSCRKPNRRLSRHRRRCTRYRGAGAMTRSGTRGRNTSFFSGRLRGIPLRAAAYRASVTARDNAGNTSQPTRVRFTVVKR